MAIINSELCHISMFPLYFTRALALANALDRMRYKVRFLTLFITSLFENVSALHLLLSYRVRTLTKKRKKKGEEKLEGGIRERKGSKREPKGSGTFKAQHEQRRGRASAISIGRKEHDPAACACVGAELLIIC